MCTCPWLPSGPYHIVNTVVRSLTAHQVWLGPVLPVSGWVLRLTSLTDWRQFGPSVRHTCKLHGQCFEVFVASGCWGLRCDILTATLEVTHHQGPSWAVDITPRTAVSCVASPVLQDCPGVLLPV
jgi:hypothetical protein